MATPDTHSKTALGALGAAPFAMSFLLAPLVWVAAYWGGWTVFLLPIAMWYGFSVLDRVLGVNLGNADPDADGAQLFWHKAIVLVWPIVQFATLFALLWYVPRAEHLGTAERIGVFMGMGALTGTIGINYSHELMHQKSALERWLADILLAMVLYSHFRSEHLRVHHLYVGTPRDPVTARFNESFYRFYPRVLWGCLRSAFLAERQLLARRGLHWTSPRNPFWRYWGLQAAMLWLAWALGGWSGVGLFALQASVAVWQLELVNYVEHYGLTRKHLGDGKYEHVRPHHSWNAAQKASNWLLINLQRHSDHHYKPERRFPLLQNYTAKEAPQLPFGYPVMTVVAMIPPLWRKWMNPRVRQWRAQYYPDISDWAAYNKMATPMPGRV